MFNRLVTLTVVLILFSVSFSSAEQQRTITEQDLIDQMFNPDSSRIIESIEQASDINYSNEFYSPGFNSYVRVMAEYDTDLYVAGYFSAVNNVEAPGLVRWNGSAWETVASNLQRYSFYWSRGSIYDMCDLNGSLYVVGSFDKIDDNLISQIARYDGASWSAVGSVLPNSTVQSVTAYNNLLVIGGSFTQIGASVAYYIGAWNGSSWIPLNAPFEVSDHSYVNEMIEYDGKLYVTGSYVSTLGEFLLCYDGSVWTEAVEQTAGIPDLRPLKDMYELSVYDNKLIAYGKFAQPDDSIITTMAAWDGLTWEEMPLPANGVDKMVVNNDTLFVISNEHIEFWDGMSWIAEQTAYHGQMMDAISYNNTIVTGGNIIHSNTMHDYIAKWETNSFTSFYTLPGKGLDYPVTSFALYNNQLICGGEFYFAGSEYRRNISAYDGTSWQIVGDSDITFTNYMGVKCLYEYNGNILASGYNNQDFPVLQYDGVSWTEFVTFPFFTRIEDMIEYDGMMIFSGNLTYFDGVDSSHNLVGYDGANFHTFGTGTLGNNMHPNLQNVITSLEVYDNKLIIGGCFSWVDSVYMPRFAAWDGSSWSDLGFPYDWQWIHDMTIHDGKLIVAGSDIAQYDGTSWELIGEVYGSVYALYSDVNHLVIGGNFSDINGISANSVASYDGSCWGNFGSGIDGEVEAITKYDGNYYFGGTFDFAGQKPSSFITSWNAPIQSCACCNGEMRGDINNDHVDTPDVTDLLYLVDFMFAEPAGPSPVCTDEADVDGSGEVDVSDLLYLVDYMFLYPAGPAPQGCS